MLKPSITFDQNAVKPLWHYCTLEDIKEMIRSDVAELNRYLLLQAEDLVKAKRLESTPDYRLTALVRAWEHTQDVHWSWYRELLNDHTTATLRPEGLGQEAVG